MGFTNMKIIGDFANKCFVGVVGKIQIGIDLSVNGCILFTMYKFYFNTIDLKAQKEGKYEIGKPKLRNNIRLSMLAAHVSLFHVSS